MRRHNNWLMPDLASARRTTHDLPQARRPCARPFAGAQDMDMTGLHAANVWHTSNLVHAAEAGRVLGAAEGMIGVSLPSPRQRLKGEERWVAALP